MNLKSCVKLCVIFTVCVTFLGGFSLLTKATKVDNTMKNNDKTTTENTQSIVLGMGCFWGAEKRMSELPGVLDVESGYANGDIPGNYEAVLAHERALHYGRAQGRNHAESLKLLSILFV